MFQSFLFFSSLLILPYLRDLDASMDKKMPTFLKSEFKSTPYKRRHGVFYVDALSASASPNGRVYMLLKLVLIRAWQSKDVNNFLQTSRNIKGHQRKEAQLEFGLKRKGKMSKERDGS